VKKIFFDLKSWGPLKNFKTRSGPYLGLGLSINVKKRNENLAGLSLKVMLFPNKAGGGDGGAQCDFDCAHSKVCDGENAVMILDMLRFTKTIILRAMCLLE
jgi:hypothetical protein